MAIEPVPRELALEPKATAPTVPEVTVAFGPTATEDEPSTLALWPKETLPVAPVLVAAFGPMAIELVAFAPSLFQFFVPSVLPSSDLTEK